MFNLHLWSTWHRYAYIEVFHILIFFICPTPVSVTEEVYKVVKHLGGLNVPHEAIRSWPQLEIIYCMSWCATFTFSSAFRLMCIRSVSSTNNTYARCPVRLEIGHSVHHVISFYLHIELWCWLLSNLPDTRRYIDRFLENWVWLYCEKRFWSLHMLSKGIVSFIQLLLALTQLLQGELQNLGRPAMQLHVQ